MNNKITLLLFCTLALSACSDSGEAPSTGPSVVLPTTNAPGDFLGDSGSGGVVGELPDTTVVDSMEPPADTTDMDLTPVEEVADSDDELITEDPSTDEGMFIEDTSADDDLLIEDDTTEDDTVVEDPATDDGMFIEDTTSSEPVASMGSGALFLLPGDCVLADGDNGMQFCISEAAGSRLFAVNATGSLVFSSTLSDQGSNTDPLVLGGEGAFVVRQSATSPNNRILTSFDANGNELYEALLSGDLVTVVDGIVEGPNLFLHTKNSFGDSSILQIDSASGRQNSVLNFPGRVVGPLDIESFDGITALALELDGVTVFHDLNTLEPITRIFTLDPTNFQQAFSEQMNTLRGDYLFDFEAVLNATIAMFDATSEETEMMCAGDGSVVLLPENSFVSENQFTRAFQYNDCGINGLIVNGSMQHSLFDIETLNGVNGSETWELEGMSLSRELSTLDANGEPATETKTVIGSVRNVSVFNADDITSERILLIGRFAQTFAGDEIFSVTNASYSRLMTTDSPNLPSGGFEVMEQGSLLVRGTNDVAVDINTNQPFVYLNSGTLTDVSELTDPPIAGTISLLASDGSTLTVDASRAGVNLQNYLLTQRGTESTIDAVWTVAPLSTSTGIFD